VADLISYRPAFRRRLTSSGKVSLKVTLEEEEATQQASTPPSPSCGC
jgi:hypothetical protein